MTFLTAERARELCGYNPETGRLFLKSVPHHARIGMSKGRYNITLDKVLYQEHRVVWLWHRGEWPKYNIDHIDRNPLNNRIENLRDITQAENKQNQGVSKNNKSGFKGVTKNRTGTSYGASIEANGNRYYLGSFQSAEAAANAYSKKASEIHKYNPVANGVTFTEPKPNTTPPRRYLNAGRPQSVAVKEALEYMLIHPQETQTEVAKKFNVHRVTLSKAHTKTVCETCPTCKQSIRTR